MTRRIAVLMIILLFGVWAGPVAAVYMADITYDYTDLGSDSYQLDVTVENKSTGGDSSALDFFEIDFDAFDITGFNSVVWVNSQSWYADASDYDYGFGGTPAWVLADDSFMGSNGGGIAQGASRGGFRFTFNYSGTVALDMENLGFSWYAEFGTYKIPSDPYYDVMGSAEGTIRYEDSGQQPAIPEPGTMAIMSIGIAGLLAGAWRRRRSRV